MDATEPASEPEPRSSGVGPVLFDVRDPHHLLTAPQAAWLLHAGARALDELARRRGASGEVRVLIVGDEQMSRVHRDRAGVEGTTDVLTFDLAPGDDSVLDADLYLCADEARRRADELGLPIERELLLYVVHGALHCVGHDDRDDDAADRMHALEDELLDAIGVGATFAPGDAR